VLKHQKLIRRKAADEITVYDINSDRPIGQVENMTVGGVKLVVDEPVRVSTILYCKMKLPRKILGVKEVFFDAECRWCKKNEKTGRYDSGYRVRHVDAKDKAVVGELVRLWMIEECEAMNAQTDRKKNHKGGIFSRLFQ